MVDSVKCEIVKAMNAARASGKDICLVCKGTRLLCGLRYCPLMQRVHATKALNQKVDKTLFGPSPPSIFVGHYGYPNVFVGPMGSLDDTNSAMLDDPAKWYGMGFDDIINMRYSLIRSKAKQNIYAKSRFIEDSQELVLSTKPTDVEMEFENKPTGSISFSSVSQPMGPSAYLEKFRIAENTKIPKRVDYIVSDELKASDAAGCFYNTGYDVYYISKVLSSGSLGINKKRLVPTRWSITAVDDIIAKHLMEDIRQFPLIGDITLYSNTYLDNHFEVLLIPGAWEFEQFEAWAPKTLWTLNRDKPAIQVEYEGFGGRTRYAEKEAGGYYASRLAVTEALGRMRRQARVVVFREIYEGYVMPVGVWEVRENVRKAFMNKPTKFSSLNQAIEELKKRLRIDFDEYSSRSQILKQRRLTDF